MEINTTKTKEMIPGSFPHPLRGVNTPQLSHNTPRLQGERRERGEGEEGGKGRRKEKGKEGTPQGLVDNPHVPNPEKYPG